MSKLKTAGMFKKEHGPSLIVNQNCKYTRQFNIIELSELNFTRLNKINPEHLTHAYVHWLVDVHSASSAPAFPFVALRQEIRPQTAKCP